MKSKSFTLEQKIRILREAEGQDSILEVCRKHNIADVTFYRWRKKYGNMEIQDARRLRELEKENGELKKMLAEEMLKSRVLEHVNAKKW